MSLAEEVGVRVALLGRPEFLTGMDGVKKALGDFSAANKSAGDSSKSMAVQTQAQKDAIAALKNATVTARDAQREYEAALTGQVDASKAATEANSTYANSQEALAAADTRATEASRALAEAQAAAANATRDASAADLAALKAAEDKAAADQAEASAARAAAVADVESAQAAKDAATARKVASDEQSSFSKQARDDALSSVATAKTAATAEEDLAERTRLAGVKKVSAWESFKSTVLGITPAVEGAVTGVAAKEAETASSVEASNARMATSWETVKTASMGLLVGTTVAVAAVGAATVGMAAKFDASMEQIHTQAGVPQSAIAGLKNQVLDLSGKVAQDPDSLAEAMYHVQSSFASAGMSAAESGKVLEAAAKGATIGQANLVDVTNAMDAAVVSGIPGVQNYDQAMGALNATVGAGDMKMQDLADAFGKGNLAAVKTYGVNIKDVGAALAEFGDNNLRGAAAGTQLRMSVQSLEVPAKAGAATLKMLGLQQDSLAKDMQTGGLNKAVTDLHQRLIATGHAGNDMGQILTDAFGKRAGTGINILEDQFDRFQGKFADIDKGANTFADAWTSATQQFQFKLNATGDAAKATGIRIGEAFMPLANVLLTGLTAALTGIGNALDWLGQHKAVAVGLAAAFGVLLLPALWAIVTATWAWTAAALANPITWIVLGIMVAVGLLAAGIYELVTHWSAVWGAIKNITSSTWDWIVGAFHAGVSAVTSFLQSGFGQAIMVIFLPIIGIPNLIIQHWGTIVGFFKGVWAAISSGATSFYHGVIEPVFNGIVTVLKWVGAIVFTVLVAPFVLAFNLIKGPALEFWHGVVEPVAHGVADVFTWLYNTAIKWFTDRWNAEVNGWAMVFRWFHDSVWVPITNAVATVFHWLHDNVIKPVGDLINRVIIGIGIQWQMFHDNVWVPITNAVATVFRWLHDTVIKPVADLINRVIIGIGIQWQQFHDNIWDPLVHKVAQVFQWLHDTVIKPVGDAINTVVHGIGQAFSDCVDWIKRTWQTIQDIVSVPVRFVVSTVYGKGIKPTWDAIAGVFGLPAAPPAPAFAAGGIVDDAQAYAPAHAARGRVMPGYEPGHDRFHIQVGGGEAVMRPEWTRSMLRTHGPGAIERMNDEARAGRPPMLGGRGAWWGNHEAREAGPLAGGVRDSPFAGMYAGGGVVPDLPIPPVPGAGPDVSIGAAILSSLGNIMSIPKLVIDPKGYFTDLFKPFTGPLGAMGNSEFMKGMEAVPGKAIDGLVAKVEAYIASLFSAGGGSAAMGPESASHALDIVNATKAKGLHSDAATIAIMTGLAESSLRVLANPAVPESMTLPHDGVGNDHDSVGIFQQRQSWGPTPLLMNPFGSAQLFLNRLGGGPYGDFGAAAQRVQVSAFPGAYSKFQGQAAGLVGPPFAHGGIVGVSGGLPFGGYRALGGGIDPGSAYMVGEMGPELVAPSSSGTVIPSDLTAALGEGAGATAENLGVGHRGDVYFQPGSIVVQAAADPVATAQMVADAVSDRMARQ